MIPLQLSTVLKKSLKTNHLLRAFCIFIMNFVTTHDSKYTCLLFVFFFSRSIFILFPFFFINFCLFKPKHGKDSFELELGSSAHRHTLSVLTSLLDVASGHYRTVGNVLLGCWYVTWKLKSRVSVSTQELYGKVQKGKGKTRHYP